MSEVIDLVKSPSPGGPNVHPLNLASNGEFSIKTAYEMLSTINNSEDNLDLLFDKGWKCKGAARVKTAL